MPEKYDNMDTIDIVRDILGTQPVPYQTIHLGEPENPLDCDRNIILARTAAALLKKEK